MKKILFSCCILLAGFGSAQVPKGVTFIGGQFGYSSVKDNNAGSKTESFRIIPTVGYFFAPNWGIAGSIGYKSETSDSQKNISATQWQSSKDVSSAFVVIPSLRKFWVLDEKLSLFGQLDFPLEFGKIKNEINSTADGSTVSSTSESDYFSYGISLKPGIDYFLNPRWKIVATVGEIGYSSNKKQKSSGAKNSFNFGMNLSSISFGLKYILPRKN